MADDKTYIEAVGSAMAVIHSDYFTGLMKNGLRRAEALDCLLALITASAARPSEMPHA